MGHCVAFRLDLSTRHARTRNRLVGLDHALAQGNLIITLGKDNTPEEMDYVVETFPKIVEKLRKMSPMWQEFQDGALDSVIAPTGRGKSFSQHAAEVSGKPQHG